MELSDGALRIVPIYATFNVAEGASASVTCTNLNSQTGEQPQWINPYNQPIGTYGGGKFCTAKGPFSES